MKKTLYTILICSLLSMGLHLYLSDRSYSLSSDTVSDSIICNINDTLNCDSTLNSPYSKLGGVPISNLGFALNLILFLLTLMILIAWTDNPLLLGLALLSLSGLSALASLGMFSISWFVLQAFCPFCLLLYLLSFIILWACCFFWKNQQPFSVSQFSKLLKNSSGVFTTILLLGVATTLIVHLIFIRMYQISSVDKTVRYAVMDWQAAPVKIPSEKPLFTVGPSSEQASLTITEFADFLCSHCRRSYSILKFLKNSQPDIRIEYFSFPLDQCKGRRASCFLTKATYCAKEQGQAWNMHGIIFENQSQFAKNLGDETSYLKTLKFLAGKLNLRWEEWEKCTLSAEALQFTHKQLEAGLKLGITGTPTTFVNGKKISNRYFNETLKALKKHINK